ncbi:type-2 ice-structuring protein-like [Saccostrea echinata]|uniref:type-2 ice-structuring protein-like n=1 Tax=Saccostrea echinata TaxID=191078 RepID=UPI002A82D191|nr:type-2 ice-structuring protein-like [Saccostrea echinata]
MSTADGTDKRMSFKSDTCNTYIVYDVIMARFFQVSAERVQVFPGSCPRGYSVYIPLDITRCLRYEKTPAQYADAANACHLEGGDIIKIDSAEKFSIFKEFLVLTANISNAEVWIQGMKVSGIWRFHDGTPFIHYCPLVASNGSIETRLRSLTKDGFKCYDNVPEAQYNYVCEL